MKLTATTVALNALVISPLNARHADRLGDESIDGLAESIAILGLLQPIVIHELKKPKGKFGVIAGGRRLAALCRLHDRTETDKHSFDAIPAMLAEGDDHELREASISENFVRAALSDVEIYKATRLAVEKSKKTLTDEQLASAFGVSLARVRRILRLAFVHPEILAAYEAGEISDETLKALGGTDDQKLQLKLFRQHHDIAWKVREALNWSDRDLLKRLHLVGRDAYLAAGGKLDEDLFSENVSIADPTILADLWQQRLNAEAERVQALYPDRQLTVGEPPKTQYGTDYALRADPVLVLTAEEEAALVNLETASNQMNCELGEALDFDQIEENGIEWQDGQGDYDLTVLDTLPLIPDASRERVLEVGQLLTTNRAAIAALEDKPKSIPPGATVVSFEVRGDEVVPQFWYPDRKAAGLTTATSKARPQAGPDGGGDRGGGVAVPLDPADPPLSDRARVWLRTAKQQIGMRVLLGDAGGVGTILRRDAHLALVFAMTQQLFHRTHSNGARGDIGLVWQFAGERAQIAPEYAEELVKPDLSGIPGFRAVDNDVPYSVAFRRFLDFATADEIDTCAAACFAAKLDVGLEDGGMSLAELVLAPALGDPLLIRRHWTPPSALFGLFRKGTLLAWLGEFHANFKTGWSHFKLPEIVTSLPQFMAADDDAASRFGMGGDTRPRVRSWLPKWLRWPTSAQIEEREAGWQGEHDARAPFADEADDEDGTDEPVAEAAE